MHDLLGQPTSTPGALRARRVIRVLGPVFAGTITIALVHAFGTLHQAGLLVLCAGLVLASAWALHHEVGMLRLRRLTIPGVWYLTYLPMILAPSCFVYSNHPGPTRGLFITAVLSLLATVPVGVALVNRIARFHCQEVDRYLISPVREPSTPRRVAVACVIALTVALGLVGLYLREVKEVPIFHMMRHPGDYVTLILLREESLKLLASPLTPLFYMLRTFGFPVLILTTLGFWSIWRRTGWLCLFGAALSGGLLYASFSIAKAPVAQIVLIVGLFLFLRSGQHVPRRFLILGGILTIVLLLIFPVAVVLALHHGGDVDLAAAILALGRRLFYLPAEVIYWYFTLFPGPEGYLHGRTIGDMAWLMGWEYFNAPNFVGRYGLNSWIASVNANGAFIGNLHADFGPVGVVVGGLAAGVLMQALQVWLVRRRKTVFNLATYAYFLYAFWLLHSTSLPIVLSSWGVLTLFVAPGVWRTLRAGLARFRDAKRWGRARQSVV